MTHYTCVCGETQPAAVDRQGRPTLSDGWVTVSLDERGGVRRKILCRSCHTELREWLRTRRK